MIFVSPDLVIRRFISFPILTSRSWMLDSIFFGPNLQRSPSSELAIKCNLLLLYSKELIDPMQMGANGM